MQRARNWWSVVLWFVSCSFVCVSVPAVSAQVATDYSLDEVSPVANLSSGDSAQGIASSVSNRELGEVVRRAYLAAFDGWSTDEVLLQDALNQRFQEQCRKDLPGAEPRDLNWSLLNLRKAGKLRGTKVTKRRQDNHSTYQHLAEIVARSCQDKHKTSTDRIMCDPKLRAEFDSLAKSLAPKIDAYLLRKAAIGLRKARRLRPELVLRIADWDRQITSRPAAELAMALESIPKQPGIYIFSDKTGYLYIGESVDLRKRLTEHLNESDRESLASYFKQHGIEGVQIELHAFPKNSRARLVSVRRAYESELIASRKPRFNVRP